jgi:hypothetical protein
MSPHPKAICFDEKRFQRQQAVVALQALRGVWSHYDMAQSMGQKLGDGAVLFGRLQGEEDGAYYTLESKQ